MTRRRLLAVAVFAGGLAGAAWVRLGPLPPGLLDLEPRASTTVVDRYGQPLYETRDANGMRGEWIDARDIPPILAQATMAAEDHRFRSHVGLDPVAIARAMWRNVRARRIVEGGSTITQQVAQLLVARQSTGGAARRGSRGWRAQAYEALIALRLERRLSKDEILALYLNLAPYGNQIEGVQRASRAYMGGALSRDRVLTPAEAAFLAALPQQPSRYNPWRDPEAARPRQQRILTTMALEGWLDSEAYQTASRERLTLRREVAGSIAPHFVERVLADAAADPSRRITTTLDATLQRTVHGIIAAHRAELDAHHAANIAVAVLDNRRGEWLAWEGSGNYVDATHGGAIDGVVTARQPGSALKPFTYAAAFERDHHPGTVLPDVPSQFPTAVPGVLYSPQNYDGRFRGPLLARVALAGSENVPAVAVASDIGVPAVARILRRLGFTTLDRNAAHYGLGLTLGNAEVRLDELVAAYSVLARGGTFVAPRRILMGDAAPHGAASGTAELGAAERVLSERTAFWITDILSDAEARAYIFGRGGSLEFPFVVAAKTGTSQAYHDNWAIGYTRDVTVGVWVGNFDRTPLRGSSGVTGAGPIFHAVLLAAVERVTGTLPIDDRTAIVAPTPDSRRATLCAVSGMTATNACARRVSEWVPADRRILDCTWHHHGDGGLITAWPTEYEYWARQEGLWQDATARATIALPGSASMTAPRAAAVISERSESASVPRVLTIVAPLSGATYLIDPTLRAEFQTLPLRAAGAARQAPLEWFVNGTRVGTSTAGGTIRWPLARGTHAITVRDGEGRSAETRIEVR